MSSNDAWVKFWICAYSCTDSYPWGKCRCGMEKITCLLGFCLDASLKLLMYLMSPDFQLRLNTVCLTCFFLCSIISWTVLFIAVSCFLLMLSGIWNSWKVAVIHKEGVGQWFTSSMLMVALKDLGFLACCNCLPKIQILVISLQK